MPIQSLTSTLRPGYLVVLRTSVSGNVRHLKTTINEGSVDADGAFHEEWQTERVIADKAELEEARKLVSRTCGWIAGKCIQTSFTLLCLKERFSELVASYEAAVAAVAEFNSRARVTRVSLVMITGEIADNDEKAMRALRLEVTELIEEMTRGVNAMDAEAIRKAATKAKTVSKMLSEQASEKLGEAIRAARSVATKLVKAGEQAAIEVDTEVRASLLAARATFLDLDETALLVARATTDARTIDLEPTEATSDVDASAERMKQQHAAAELIRDRRLVYDQRGNAIGELD